MTLDRSKQPPFSPPDDVTMPVSEAVATTNGIELHTLNSGESELIRLSLVFRAGSSWQAQPFQASAALGMLNQGTNLHSAAAIAEKLDFYGSIYDVNIDRDYTVVTICSLSKFFGPTVELLEEILLHPAFPEHELAVYADRRKAALSIERGKVAYRARELFTEALFGAKHPYGVFSQAAGYDKLDPVLLRDFYTRRYTAENCFAVGSGLISGKEISAMEALLSKIPSAPQSRSDERKFPVIKKNPYVYIEQEGAVQSAIRIGRVMFPRTHPDYIDMQVLCTVLGGYFGSRLVSNLREEKGYTYGVFAAMVNMEKSGYMAIGTEVGAQFTEAAVAEIFREIGRLREEAIPGEELRIVKNMITGELMRLLDGPFGIADITIENIQNGTGNSYLDRFVHEVNAITPAHLQTLARRYLDPREFTTVIVGKKQGEI